MLTGRPGYSKIDSTFVKGVPYTVRGHIRPLLNTEFLQPGVFFSTVSHGTIHVDESYIRR
jgi:hypothetical protein